MKTYFIRKFFLGNRIIFFASSLLFMSVLSCTYESVHINTKQDINDGKLAIKKFYAYVSRNDSLSIKSIISDSLREALAPTGIITLLRAINSKVGNIKSYHITDQLTRAVSGRRNETTYYSKVSVSYEKGIADERIGLIKRKGSMIEINSYHGDFR